jgi:hypothetical protein
MNAVTASPDLVDLGNDERGEARFTNRAMIEAEQRLQRAADLVATRKGGQWSVARVWTSCRAPAAPAGSVLRRRRTPGNRSGSSVMIVIPKHAGGAFQELVSQGNLRLECRRVRPPAFLRHLRVARHGKLPPQRHEQLPPPRIAEERVNEARTS